jgi:hypothetical protein
VLSEGGIDHRGLPHEHAAVPVETAAAEEAAGGRGVGLFAKTPHLGPGELDVAVAGIGPPRADAEHHQEPALGQPRGPLDGLPEHRFPRDHVIGRKHPHHRFRIEPEQDPRRQADARRGVAAHGLSDDVIGRNLRQLPNDLGPQSSIGDDPETRRRRQRPQPGIGLLDQRLGAQHRQHLLGPGFAAARPETRAPPAGHDQDVEVGQHSQNSGVRSQESEWPRIN